MGILSYHVTSHKHAKLGGKSLVIKITKREELTLVTKLEYERWANFHLVHI